MMVDVKGRPNDQHKHVTSRGKRNLLFSLFGVNFYSVEKTVLMKMVTVAVVVGGMFIFSYGFGLAGVVIGSEVFLMLFADISICRRSDKIKKWTIINFFFLYGLAIICLSVYGSV